MMRGLKRHNTDHIQHILHVASCMMRGLKLILTASCLFCFHVASCMMRGLKPISKFSMILSPCRILYDAWIETERGIHQLSRKTTSHLV